MGPEKRHKQDIGITGGGKGSNMIYVKGLPHKKIASKNMIEFIADFVEKRSNELLKS